MVVMSGLLQGGISDLATRCFAEALISSKQMATLTNADAVNTQRYICQVLEQIEKKIAHDPDNLELFITSVLEPMGAFADKLISQLRKLHNSLLVSLLMHILLIDLPKGAGDDDEEMDTR